MIIHWHIYRARREGRSAVGFASKGALFPRQVRIALLAPLLMIALSVGCGPPRPASISSVEVSAVSDPPPRSDAELVALSEAVLRAAAEMSAAAAAINAAAASLRQSSVAEDVAEPTLPGPSGNSVGLVEYAPEEHYHVRQRSVPANSWNRCSVARGGRRPGRKLPGGEDSG